MERITATFDAQTVAAIRRIAGKRGISAFLQEAARERLAKLELLELLDELDAKHGAPTPAVMPRSIARPTASAVGTRRSPTGELLLASGKRSADVHEAAPGYAAGRARIASAVRARQRGALRALG